MFVAGVFAGKVWFFSVFVIILGKDINGKLDCWGVGVLLCLDCLSGIWVVSSSFVSSTGRHREVGITFSGELA